MAAIEAKKKEIKDHRSMEIHQMKQEGAAYMLVYIKISQLLLECLVDSPNTTNRAQVKARAVALSEQEQPLELTFVDIAVLFENRTVCHSSLI